MSGVTTIVAGITLTAGEIAAAQAGGEDALGMLAGLKIGAADLTAQTKAIVNKIGAGANATTLTNMITSALA